MKVKGEGLIRRRISVRGIVQGVGFRPFVYRIAVRNGLSGSVKNLGDAGVEIIVEGSPEQIGQFLQDLKLRKPPLAEIEGLEIAELSRDGLLSSFKIEHSERGEGGSGTIPPDTAICPSCLEDLRGPSRYHGYWATSCTDCGPRFTTIRALPYDRERTSFAEFPMCPDCAKEYTDPLDRRYHAQTIACPRCGPKLYFNGSPEGDPILKAALALKAGRIVAIKGLGGTHLACDATNEAVVSRLRQRLGRPAQPFALMATEAQLPQLAEVSPQEWEMLRSPRRPIVVLNKRRDSPLAHSVAPGLHNVGIMLPYTGLHYLLFEHLPFPLVMTSANMPGRPMLIEDDEIRSRLEGIADDFLLHEREIVARCDDSVLRFTSGWRFIRRSRGWVPTPLELDLGVEPLLALGAELNNTFTLSIDGRCYLSQHIGHVDDPETLQFLREAIEHLLSITGAKLPRLLACDLHPRFLTSQLARELGEKVIPVQHHHAHIAAVLGEYGLERVVGLALDGVGYGTDGRIWGGEVLLADRADFSRVGGLKSVPMAGGDLATRFPARMAAGFLYAAGLRGPELKRLLERHLSFRSPQELELVLRQLERGLNVFQTSGAGRFLDAVSALLGICSERTYEGEPAMRLEAAAKEGKVIRLEPPFTAEGGRRVLDTPRLFLELLELKLKGRHRPEDIAATAQWALAAGLARLAILAAQESGLKEVALAGGVAYNEAIVGIIKDEVEGAGLRLYVNEKVPCGDGGISFGQAVVAGTRLQLGLV
ncbi:MAG: carbamoyltransferase HypF [Candidatus Bipolaricaulia bacterium]